MLSFLKNKSPFEFDGFRIVSHVRSYREQQGLSVSQLSDLTSISEKTIEAIEEERFMPSFVEAALLSFCLHAKFSDLFVFEISSDDYNFMR